MTERELYLKIKPLLEGYTEGLFWDFKKTLSDTGEIIRDILAFSNSHHSEDSFIIVGVSESVSPQKNHKVKLSTEDRRRLNTDAKYLYLPGKWDVHGLTAGEIDTMRKFSEQLSQQLACSMLICQPKCEYIPVSIGKKRWLYVVIIKSVPGVFLSNKDIPQERNGNKIAVKQSVMYVRIADTTIGARTDVASATEYIRVWREYITWLKKSGSSMLNIEGNIDE